MPKAIYNILEKYANPTDPLENERKECAAGEYPAKVQNLPGLHITTIDIPATGNKEQWFNFLHQFQIAHGIVVLRSVGQSVWDKDEYITMQDMWCELCECADSRPSLVISIADGDIRSGMMAIPAMSTISLATPDATFGFPDVRVGGVPAVMACTMRKRCADTVIRKMMLDGESIDACEAQRIGLVDFVGDVEAELARLIYRNCQQKVIYHMYGPDVDKIEDKA